MSITTFQKVTLVSCIVLCVSLFLPKMMLYGVKKEMMQKTAGPGYYPTGLPRKQPPEGLEPWEAESGYQETLSSEAIAKAQAKGNMWGNKKSNHFGQIVPIYGVGILFYILHIFFKLTRQDKKAKPAARCPIPNSESLAQNISEEELARLEARLSHAEMLMNRVMSSSSTRTESVKSQRSSRRKRESSLLHRLRRFGRSLQEDQREEVTPEMEAEEVPYGLDWEGYPEETFPRYDEPCGPRKYDTIIVEAPPPDQRSAEELAEQMDKEDEEMERELGVIEEGDEDMEETEEKTEEEEDEEDEEEEEEEEEEETDDEMLQFKEPEEEVEEEEEEEEVGEETPCLPHPESVEERRSQVQGGVGRLFGLTSGDPPECRRRRITFSEHKDIFRYPREGTIDEEEEEEEEEDEDEEEDEEEEGEDDEEDEEGVAGEQRVSSGVRVGVMEVDPLMEAESLKFSTEASSEDETESERMEQEGGENEDKNDDDEEEDSDDDYDDDEEDEDDDQEVGLQEFLSTYRPAMNTRLSQAKVDPPPTSSQLRMRNKGKDKKV